MYLLFVSWPVWKDNIFLNCFSKVYRDHAEAHAKAKNASRIGDEPNHLLARSKKNSFYYL